MTSPAPPSLADLLAKLDAVQADVHELKFRGTFKRNGDSIKAYLWRQVTQQVTFNRLCWAVVAIFVFGGRFNGWVTTATTALTTVTRLEATSAQELAHVAAIDAAVAQLQEAQARFVTKADLEALRATIIREVGMVQRRDLKDRIEPLSVRLDRIEDSLRGRP